MKIFTAAYTVTTAALLAAGVMAMMLDISDVIDIPKLLISTLLLTGYGMMLAGLLTGLILIMKRYISDD